MSKGKKVQKGEEEALVTLKIKRSTKTELTKTKNLMGFYMEKNVSYDEVIQALLEQAPKSLFTMVPSEEEAQKSGGQG